MDNTLYLITEDDISITYWFISADQVQIGSSVFDYSVSGDGKTLVVDGERFEKTTKTLAMSWRITRACCELYIGEYGLIGWLLLPAAGFTSYQNVGNTAIACAAFIDVAIIALVTLIIILFARLSKKK